MFGNMIGGAPPILLLVSLVAQAPDVALAKRDFVFIGEEPAEAAGGTVLAETCQEESEDQKLNRQFQELLEQNERYAEEVYQTLQRRSGHLDWRQIHAERVAEAAKASNMSASVFMETMGDIVAEQYTSQELMSKSRGRYTFRNFVDVEGTEAWGSPTPAPPPLNLGGSGFSLLKGISFASGTWSISGTVNGEVWENVAFAEGNQPAEVPKDKDATLQIVPGAEHKVGVKGDLKVAQSASFAFDRDASGLKDEGLDGYSVLLAMTENSGCSGVPASVTGVELRYETRWKSDTHEICAPSAVADMEYSHVCQDTMQMIEAKEIQKGFRFDCAVPFFRYGFESHQAVDLAITMNTMKPVKGVLIFDMHPFDVIDAISLPDDPLEDGTSAEDYRLPDEVVQFVCITVTSGSVKVAPGCIAADRILSVKKSQYKTAQSTFDTPERVGWEVLFKEPHPTGDVVSIKYKNLNDARNAFVTRTPGNLSSVLLDQQFTLETLNKIKELGKKPEPELTNAFQFSKPIQITTMMVPDDNAEESDEPRDLRINPALCMATFQAPDEKTTLTIAYSARRTDSGQLVTEIDVEGMEKLQAFSKGAWGGIKVTRKDKIHADYVKEFNKLKNEMSYKVQVNTKTPEGFVQGLVGKNLNATLLNEMSVDALPDCTEEDEDGDIADVSIYNVDSFTYMPYIQGENVEDELLHLEELLSFGFRADPIICPDADFGVTGSADKRPFGCASGGMETLEVMKGPSVIEICRVTDASQMAFIEAGSGPGPLPLNNFKFNPGLTSADAGDFTFTWSEPANAQKTYQAEIVRKPGTGLSIKYNGKTASQTVSSILVRGTNWAMQMSLEAASASDAVFADMMGVTLDGLQISLKPGIGDDANSCFMYLDNSVTKTKLKMVMDTSTGKATTSYTQLRDELALLGKKNKAATALSNKINVDFTKFFLTSVDDDTRVAIQAVDKSGRTVPFQQFQCDKKAQPSTALAAYKFHLQPSFDPDMTQEYASDWVQCFPHKVEEAAMHDIWQSRIDNMQSGSHGCATAKGWSASALAEELAFAAQLDKASKVAIATAQDSCTFSPKQKVIADMSGIDLGVASAEWEQTIDTLVGQMRQALDATLLDTQEKIKECLIKEKNAFAELLTAREHSARKNLHSAELSEEDEGAEKMLSQVWVEGDAAHTKYVTAQKETDDNIDKMLAEAFMGKSALPDQAAALKKGLEERFKSATEALRKDQAKFKAHIEQFHKGLAEKYKKSKALSSKHAICLGDGSGDKYSMCVCPLPYGQETVDEELYAGSALRMRMWLRGKGEPAAGATMEIKDGDLSKFKSFAKGQEDDYNYLRSGVTFQGQHSPAIFAFGGADYTATRMSRPYAPGLQFGAWDAVAPVGTKLRPVIKGSPYSKKTNTKTIVKDLFKAGVQNSRVAALRSAKSENPCMLAIFKVACLTGEYCTPTAAAFDKMIYGPASKDNVRTDPNTAFTHEDLVIERMIDLSTLSGLRTIELDMIDAGDTPFRSELGKAIRITFDDGSKNDIKKPHESGELYLFPGGWTYLGKEGLNNALLPHRRSVSQVDTLYIAVKQRIQMCQIKKIGVMNNMYEKSLGYGLGLRPVKGIALATFAPMAFTVHKKTLSLPAQLFGNPKSNANPMTWWDDVRNSKTMSPHPRSPGDHCLLCDGNDLFSLTADPKRTIGTCKASSTEVPYVWQDEDGLSPLPRFLKWTRGDRMSYVQATTVNNNGAQVGMNDPRGLYDVTSKEDTVALLGYLEKRHGLTLSPIMTTPKHVMFGLEMIQKVIRAISKKVMMVFNSLLGFFKKLLKKEGCQVQKRTAVKKGFLDVDKWDDGTVRKGDLGTNLPFTMWPTQAVKAIFPLSKQMAATFGDSNLVKKDWFKEKSLFDYDPDLVDNCFTMEANIFNEKKVGEAVHKSLQAKYLHLCTNSFGASEDAKRNPDAKGKKVYSREDVTTELRLLASENSGVLATNFDIGPGEKGACYTTCDKTLSEGSNLCPTGKCQENVLSACPDGSMCQCGTNIPLQSDVVLEKAQGTGLVDKVKGYLFGKKHCGCAPLECKANAAGMCAMAPAHGKVDADGNVKTGNPRWFLPPKNQMCIPSGKGGCELKACDAGSAGKLGFDAKGWKNCVKPSEMEEKMNAQKSSMQSLLKPELEKLAKALGKNATQYVADANTAIDQYKTPEEMMLMYLKANWPCHFDLSKDCMKNEARFKDYKKIVKTPTSRAKTVGKGIFDVIMKGGRTFATGMVASFNAAFTKDSIKETTDLIITFYLAEGANVQCFAEEFPRRVVKIPVFLAKHRFLNWLCPRGNELKKAMFADMEGKGTMKKAGHYALTFLRGVCWFSRSFVTTGAPKFIMWAAKKLWAGVKGVFSAIGSMFSSKFDLKAVQDTPVIANPPTLKKDRMARDGKVRALSDKLAGSAEDLAIPAIGVMGASVGFLDATLGSSGILASLPGVASSASASNGCVAWSMMGLWSGPGGMGLCAIWYLIVARAVDVVLFPPHYLGSSGTQEYILKKIKTGTYKASAYERPPHQQLFANLLDDARSYTEDPLSEEAGELVEGHIEPEALLNMTNLHEVFRHTFEF